MIQKAQKGLSCGSEPLVSPDMRTVCSLLLLFVPAVDWILILKKKQLIHVLIEYLKCILACIKQNDLGFFNT